MLHLRYNPAPFLLYRMQITYVLLISNVVLKLIKKVRKFFFQNLVLLVLPVKPP